MPTTLADALVRLTVPDLKDVASHLADPATAGRKEVLIERILAAMLGPELKALWIRLDETQQAAVAEAVHHPLGEYSEQRFRAKYQRVPSFSLAGTKSYGYSGSRCSALCLFIHYAMDERRYFVPAELRSRLKEFVPEPPPVDLRSSDTPADNEGLTIRLTEREALL